MNRILSEESEYDITLIAPIEALLKNIRDSRLTFNDYRELPFGAALSGIYTLNFTKVDGPTQNIHIQILEDQQCIQKITDPPGVIRIEIEKIHQKNRGQRRYNLSILANAADIFHRYAGTSPSISQ